MSALLETVTLVVSAAVDWIGTFVTCCTNTPLIMLFITFPLVGFGVGLLKRLIRL